MEDLNKVYDMVANASAMDNQIPNRRSCIIIKMQEELGEISAEYLKEINYKKSDQSTSKSIYNQKEEAVDLLITVLDFMNDLKMTEEEIHKIAETKINKWINKHING